MHLHSPTHLNVNLHFIYSFQSLSHLPAPPSSSGYPHEMADNTTIACTDVGNSLSNPICCTANNLGSGACNAIFAPDRILDHGCKFRNCVDTCSDPRLLYVSHVQINGTGNGIDPIQRYAACVNVPTISQAMKQGALTGTNAVAAQRYLGRNATEDDLRKITSAVTDCLSSTCRVSRGKDGCYNEFCSPVKLLTDPSTPNIRGINNCINKLCSSSYEALPYADADVVGVGVRAVPKLCLQSFLTNLLDIGLHIIRLTMCLSGHHMDRPFYHRCISQMAHRLEQAPGSAG